MLSLIVRCCRVGAALRVVLWHCSASDHSSAEQERGLCCRAGSAGASSGSRSQAASEYWPSWLRGHASSLQFIAHRHPQPPPFRILFSLLLCFRSCLLIRSFLSLRPSILTFLPASAPSLSFLTLSSSNSTSHCPSSFLFAPLYPHFLTHPPLSSSYTRFLRRSSCAAPPFSEPPNLPIPFLRANCSHLVGCLGFGRGFQRGR